ncbi:MAG: polyprenyl synthetase family protein [Planctomycetota bacterium]|jgi:octaprenyl-diphosphate synthase|nr:polyprenyl synthetase family protein [Planctomycetota bacterium]
MTAPDARLVLLQEPVAEGLERMRELLAGQLDEASPAVRDMTGHIARFRGKQLRASLTLLAGEAGGNSTDEHPAVACIVEMIHLATLVHDDVLDGATVRRRVACVNERWDNQVAVLLGDFLYARAFALSTELSSRMCSRVLSEATRRICVGEIEQSTRRYDFEMSQGDYEAIAGAKTATLYGAACELGACYPSGNEEGGARMRAFGYEIGLAFQIIDDCLDVVGNPEVVGKSVGNDVEDGKVTLPVLWTYARASEAARSRIRDAYTLPAEAVEEAASGRGRAELLRSVCDLEPGVEYALARAGELTRGALERLEGLGASQARDALEALGGYVLERRW